LQEPAIKSRPARAAASKPSTQTVSPDSVTRTSNGISHDLTSNTPPVNIPVPTPYRQRDYIDQAICQVFHSHYHQPKGRIKSMYCNMYYTIQNLISVFFFFFSFIRILYKQGHGDCQENELSFVRIYSNKS
jgi:hypothetical protein